MDVYGPAPVQYVFLDVVRFTQKRSVEAQSDIVKSLNSIVKTTLSDTEIDLSDCILLPTGDGMAIAILKLDPFDLSLKLALSILEKIADHNKETLDSKRKFEVRIGVNQNTDNVILDINGSRNVAGRGINMAQRVMSHADGGQIMMGQQVFETLREREAYEGAFREFSGKDKHGNRFPIYQLIRSDIAGLDTNPPTQLRPTVPAKPQLNEYTAHLITHAVLHHDFLMKHRLEVRFEYAATVFLHLLATDSMKNIKRSHFQEHDASVDFDSDGSPAPGYKKISESEFSVIAEFSSFITEKLWGMQEFFEQGNYSTLWPFPTGKGIRHVKEKFPDIWHFIMGQPADLDIGQS